MTTMTMTLEPTYTQTHNAVMFDKILKPPVYKLYCILTSHMDKKTRITKRHAKTLADEMDRSVRSIERYTRVLIKAGIVERRYCFSKHTGKQLANEYLVIGGYAKRYDNDKHKYTPRQNGRSQSDKTVGHNIKDSLCIQDNNSKEGSHTPQDSMYLGSEDKAMSHDTNLQASFSNTEHQEEIIRSANNCLDKAEGVTSAGEAGSVLGLDDVPEVLRATARYMLMCSGRSVLSAQEIMRLRQLGDIHTPTRIQKEIDTAVERFEAENRPLRCLSFNYIWAALKNQVSRTRTRRAKKSKTAEEYFSAEAEKAWKQFQFMREKQFGEWQCKQAEAAWNVKYAAEYAEQESIIQPEVESSAPQPVVPEGMSETESQTPVVEEQVEPTPVISASEQVIPDEVSAPIEVVEEVAEAEFEAANDSPMTVEEAKKVIAEVLPEKKSEAKIEPEQIELWDKIKKRADKLDREYEAKAENFEVDEDGYTIHPELGVDPELDELEARMMEPVPLLEYLRLKFPGESDEVLQSFDKSDKRTLEEARDIDDACAICTDDNCEQHDDKQCAHLIGICNRKFGSMRPIPTIETNPWGKRFMSVRMGGCLRCRFAQQTKEDPEFIRKVKKSGLTEAQANKTLATYENTTPETTVAKALAILAAKNNKSLILAGNSGSGKTHLGIGIAIEAMKNDRQALVINAPEMLDNLRRAAREHTGFFELMQKYKDVSCLVLDDLGKERSTEASNDYLYQIIDYRYRHGLQTIVTTNALKPEDIYKPWTEKTMKPIISRLMENGDWITITDSADHRQQRLYNCGNI